MPIKSDKQKRLMQAVANNPEFAKKAGIPQSVGEKFMKYGKEKKVTGFKPCASCPTPAKCKAAGKCAAKGKRK